MVYININTQNAHKHTIIRMHTETYIRIYAHARTHTHIYTQI